MSVIAERKILSQDHIFPSSSPYVSPPPPSLPCSCQKGTQYVRLRPVTPFPSKPTVGVTTREDELFGDGLVADPPLRKGLARSAPAALRRGEEGSHRGILPASLPASTWRRRHRCAKIRAFSSHLASKRTPPLLPPFLGPPRQHRIPRRAAASLDFQLLHVPTLPRSEEGSGGGCTRAFPKKIPIVPHNF